MINFSSKVIAVKAVRDLAEGRKPPTVEIKDGTITIQYSQRASLLEIKNLVEAIMRLGATEYAERGHKGFEEYCGTVNIEPVITLW